MARARGYEPFHRSPDQDALLDAIVEGAAAGGVGVFDLDGCLFDTRPRQVHILREMASQQDLPELYRVGVEHFKDWSLTTTLRLAGLDDERVAALADPVREFWKHRFFTSAYVLHDHAMPGAPKLVWQCFRAGMQVVYLTGRDETMRAGTEEALRRFGFPIGRPGTLLLVKPDFATDDTEFKEEALREIVRLGPPRLFMDNEPANVNLFRQRFPEARVVFLETDHSPRPDEPHASIPWLRSFLRSV